MSLLVLKAYGTCAFFDGCAWPGAILPTSTAEFANCPIDTEVAAG